LHPCFYEGFIKKLWQAQATVGKESEKGSKEGEKGCKAQGIKGIQANFLSREFNQNYERNHFLADAI